MSVRFWDYIPDDSGESFFVRCQDENGVRHKLAFNTEHQAFMFITALAGVGCSPHMVEKLSQEDEGQ